MPRREEGGVSFVLRPGPYTARRAARSWHPPFRAALALRRGAGDATMNSPGGARPVSEGFLARPTGGYSLAAPLFSLIPSGAAFAPSRSDAIRPPPSAPSLPAENTRWYGRPFAGGPGPIGPARNELPNFALKAFSEVAPDVVTLHTKAAVDEVGLPL
jgi:hypothetical protein